MFLDGAGWHKARALVIPERVHLHLLPPYSPELNPSEWVWDHMRENDFGNQTFHSLASVEVQTWRSLAKLQNDPALVRSLTFHAWIERSLEPFGKLIV